MPHLSHVLTMNNTQLINTTWQSIGPTSLAFQIWKQHQVLERKPTEKLTVTVCLESVSPPTKFTTQTKDQTPFQKVCQRPLDETGKSLELNYNPFNDNKNQTRDIWFDKERVISFSIQYVVIWWIVLSFRARISKLLSLAGVPSIVGRLQ